jgi:hypothetical protein
MSKESLQRAQNAANLRQRSYAVGSVDWLGASGFAQVHERAIYALLQRAAHDDKAATRLVQEVTKMIRSKVRSNRWRVRGQSDVVLLAEAVVAYWRNPHCGDCGGVGLASNGQIRHDTCTTCSGTGQRPVPQSDHIGLNRSIEIEHLERYFRELVVRMDDLAAQHVVATARRLG